MRYTHPDAITPTTDACDRRQPGARLALPVMIVATVFVAAHVAAASGQPVKQEGQDVKSFAITATLELGSKAALKAENIRFATFPSGKRCAFVCVGPRSTKTIKFLGKLGFRTSVGVHPRTNAGWLKALDAAGARFVIAPWGTRGTYHSTIGGNTLQETFDAFGTSKLVLRKKLGRPIGMASGGGHIAPHAWPLSRGANSAAGYGAAYMDCNYAVVYSRAHPYMVYLGCGREKPIMLRSKSECAVGKAPNETIYYEILAAQFEGTIRRATRGQVIRFGLRDFKDKDLDELAECIEEYGKHPAIWHAGDLEICSYLSMKEKTKIRELLRGPGNRLRLTLDVEQDVFPGYLQAPISLELPAGVTVKSGRIGGVPCKVTTQKGISYVDLPLREALRNGLEFAFQTAAPDMTVPDKMGAVLSLKNTSKAPLDDIRVEWVGSPGLGGTPGLTVCGGQPAPFSLGPGAERRIELDLNTAPRSRFGVLPLRALVRAKVGGAERVFMGGFEVTVAPMLRVDMDPQVHIPLPRGRYQYFRVHVDNFNAEDKFISRKAGPCKGVVKLDLPPGMTADPPELPFELAANQRKTLVVKVTNNRWSEKPARVIPRLKLQGDERHLEVLCHGCSIGRDKTRLQYEPLDKQGLLAYASFDKGKGGDFDRSAGRPGAYYYPNHGAGLSPQGVKGWCVATERSCQIYQTYKNIDYMRGSILFWMRRDPKVRNEMQYRGHLKDPKNTWKQGVNHGNRGESMIVVEGCQKRQNGGLVLRRYPGWGKQEQYLELIYQCIDGAKYHIQAPYEKSRMYEWRHVAMLWDVAERRLELYIDGKLAGKADPGKGPWMAVPWDAGRGEGWRLILLTTDHGHWSGTCRDEVYIYNRPLSLEEIRANKARAENLADMKKR